ncbi:flavin-dependent oxidoreductase [Nonomuraea africana]|uniref:2-polyprenyl-6-methoxyphenol hydroxylase-like FAD-dependent oxidoreductase n=1 Tax=Nonomuraea africana TaxID=46171 RepID=A0ABR9KAU2_9ACTN|nr:FAD-dependent monooxygenase [Nonomuraea africana]MBE1559129.1 2-polyprenyl-6-methoxyphenol hydroxylase-like FAD-dependent oxidoreductase [Nonomuraea africana]
MRILIAGAGIGGLTAALHLHAAGLTPELVEATRRCEPLGVGINLLPAAVEELTRLGLGAELAALGVPVAEMAHFDRHGNLIWREPREGQYSVHRGELQMLLLRAVRDRLGAGAVRFGLAVEEFADGPQGVAVTCRDRVSGREVTLSAAALIGADGLRSTVRRRLHPDEGEPLTNGITMWRGISRGAPFLTGHTVAVYGCNAHAKLVVYPISRADGGLVQLNWVAEVRGPAPAPGRPLRDIRADLAARFADWSLPELDVAALFAAAPDVLELPMTDRDPLPAWGFGPVTLLGDAAHPMYPIGSNGASQAILDARALAAALSEASEPTEGLRSYEAVRLPLTNAVVAACRAMPADDILALVAARAPDGFSDIADVLSPDELATVTAAYHHTSHVASFRT